MGPTSEVKKLLATPELKIKYANVKIVYSDTTVVKEIPKTKVYVNFRDRLIIELKKDVELYEMCKMIF